MIRTGNLLRASTFHIQHLRREADQRRALRRNRASMRLRTAQLLHALTRSLDQEGQLQPIH